MQHNQNNTIAIKWLKLAAKDQGHQGAEEKLKAMPDPTWEFLESLVPTLSQDHLM